MRKFSTEVVEAGKPFWCLNVFLNGSLVKSQLFESKGEAQLAAKVEKSKLAKFKKRKSFGK